MYVYLAGTLNQKQQKVNVRKDVFARTVLTPVFPQPYPHFTLRHVDN